MIDFINFLILKWRKYSPLLLAFFIAALLYIAWRGLGIDKHTTRDGIQYENRIKFKR